MPFSYNTSLPTFKDRIRLLIFDTVESSAAFSDEEIAAFETTQPNLYLAAADFAMAKGLKVAERAFKYDTSSDSRGGLLVDRTNQPQWYFKRAEQLTKLAMTAGVDEIIEHFAFDVDAIGNDRSQYQGQLDYIDL